MARRFEPPKSFKNRPLIQAKITIGDPDDKYEKEADEMADRVMRMPQTDAPIQRQCEDCEEEALQMKPLAASNTPVIQKQGVEDDEEEMLQMQPMEEEEEMLQAKSDGGGLDVSASLSSQLSHSKGGGTGLPDATNQHMSNAFGTDFSGVRVHTDANAVQMNRSLGARAFTHGRDVYFNRGEYSPASGEGKRLLAHELTHVVQQGKVNANTIQRADYDVKGLPTDASNFPNRIFFLSGSTIVPKSEKGKLQAFKGSSTALTLKGLASEEGSDASNLVVVNARIRAVKTGLSTAGHTGSVTKKPDVTAGAGNIEYQKMRSVEIIPAGTTSAVPTAVSDVPCTNRLAGGSNYPKHWTDAEKEAQRLIANGISKLSGGRSAATNAALSRFFYNNSNATATTVSGKLTSIGAQVTRYLNAANHKCVNQCSNTSASNFGSGTSAMLTLCPSFFRDTLSKRGATTIHEAVHGTPSIRGDDIAYSHHRLIEYLGTSLSLKTPDTYVLLLQTLDGQSPKVGRPNPDTPVGMTGPESKEAKKALAWLEMYLTTAYLQTQSLYDQLHQARSSGRASWPVNGYRTMMGMAAPRFGLTAPPGLPATEADQVKLAAIFHRYRIMRQVLLNPVSITKGATDKWAPGPGSSVEVKAGFFTLSPLNQVLKLMKLIVAATPDISASLETHYIEFMNQIRTLAKKPNPPP